MARESRWLPVLTACASLGCTSASAEGRSAVPGPPPVRAPTLAEAGRAACQEEMARARGAAAAPGAPGFEEHRAELLARAKGEPVVFVRAPERVEDASTEVRRYWRALDQAASAQVTLPRVYRQLKGRPEVARRVLLREGYLYAESPDLAAALVYHVRLHDLFRARELWIHRGANIRRVVRRDRFTYEYADGPERGRRARLLFLDRVATSREALASPLHLDVRSVAHRRGFDRMQVERITEDAVIARLGYGGAWARALLDRRGVSLAVRCEIPQVGQEATIAAAKRLTLRRGRLLDAQRAVVLRQIEEALPFDEPRTEIGQQDGELRRAWKWAYDHGWTSYEVNDDHYQVFDRAGRPRPPQVCIDFITDTFERAGGTWWASQQAGNRDRSSGLLDFDSLDLDNRRSVERFVRFAWDHPRWFDVVDLEPAERVRFLDRRAFFAHLAEHRYRYAPGDVVAIHGPRNDGEAHYHSFFVFAADPVTAMPILLAGNSGRPRVRTWEGVMRSAPLRSIKHRIRPRLEWLERVTAPAEGKISRPAPLVSSPI